MLTAKVIRKQELVIRSLRSMDHTSASVKDRLLASFDLYGITDASSKLS